MLIKKTGSIDLLAYSSDFERDFGACNIKTARSFVALDPQPAAGSLLGGNLISTARGLSRQDKRDVNACVRYAQWRAGYEYDREKDARNWFASFVGVLWSMGWELEEEKLIEEYYSNFSGQLSRAYLKTIAGVNHEMAKLTEAMFEALLVDTSALWSLSTGSLRGKEFAIAPAEYDKQGRLCVHVNDYSLRARVQREEFLFWDWSEGGVTLSHRAAPLALNRAKFEEIRPQLNDRLDLIADAIFEFYKERL